MEDIFEKEGMAEESFLELTEDLSGVPELSSVPDGDYEVRLLSLERRPGREKGPFIYAEFEIISVPNAKTVRHVIMLPKETDDPKVKNRRMLSLNHMFQAL